MRNINILYEDNSVIILNKPAGLAVQGGKNVKTSLDRLLADAYKPAPLLVHRLDKDTSGVLLTAKTKEAARRFSEYFNNEQLAMSNEQLSGKNKTKAVKTYIAVCSGIPKIKAGIINTELEVHNKIKIAQTRYKLIKTGEYQEQPYSVLEIELGTGRMHQIRRHLALIGNPVLGDDKYGDFKLNKKLKQKKLLLHACRLVIPGENIDITAPCPPYIREVDAALAAIM